MRIPSWMSQHLAAVRALLILTVLLGLIYPLTITAVGRLPFLDDKADGSLVSVDGEERGSRLLGQAFVDSDGEPLRQYFQSRPSAAGEGYDPTASAASNLGPESVVDALPDPATPDDPGTPSLLTQVCRRSSAIGELEGVDGSRPFCTSNGVGAVLGVFRENGLTGKVTRVVSLNEACPSTPFRERYAGVAVECAKPGEDYSDAVTTPIRGSAPAEPVVPADAVTASASGLDPHISVEYAKLQAKRVAAERGVAVDTVEDMIKQHTTERLLGFVGEPAVNVLELNLALDEHHPVRQ